MTFAKFDKNEDAVTRRVVVPSEILNWAKQVRMDDNRDYLNKPTVHDIFIQLIMRGIRQHSLGRAKFWAIDTRAGNSTTVFHFPADLYSQIERIEEQVAKGDAKVIGTGKVSRLHVILCLLESGYMAAAKPEKKEPEFEVANQD